MACLNDAYGRLLPFANATFWFGERPLACRCDLNRSMQHLVSNYREAGVVNEATTEDLRYRS
jgi:hypothetical protein